MIDVISLLADSGLGLNDGISSTTFTIPRLETLADLPHNGLVLKWNQAQYQVSVSSLAHALEISTKLLSVIEQPTRGAKETNAGDYSFYENIVWNLDVASRLWVHSRNFDAQSGGTMTNLSTHSKQILDYVWNLTKGYNHMAKIPLFISKGYWLLARWVSELLQLCSGVVDQSLTDLVFNFICHLCEAASDSKECARACSASLTPVLVHYAKGKKALSSESSLNGLSNQSESEEKLLTECLRLIEILKRRGSTEERGTYNAKNGAEYGYERQTHTEDNSIFDELPRYVSKYMWNRDTSVLGGLDSVSLFVDLLQI